MLGVKGLENFTFDECLEQANIADIEGVKVPFLHINHLISSKKAANRPKDQIDVIYLEKIKKLLDEEGHA
jgi:predicted nucleotidyltransferase